MPKKPSEDSPHGRFAALLKKHVDGGSRPAGVRRGAKKTRDALAAETTVNVGRRTIDNYCSGATFPQDIYPILDFLFAGDPQLAGDRVELERAWKEAAGIEQPSTAPANIPRLARHFGGRDADLKAIIVVLRSAETSVAILVQGPPGIGKTELTKAAAHHPEVVRRFGVHRWFVKLETTTTAEAMRDAIVRALGHYPAQGLRAALDALGGRQCLLVLDNLETPWDSSAERMATEEVLAELIAVPGLALLASFRGQDHVAGADWALVHPVRALPARAARNIFCRISAWRAPADPVLDEFMKALGGVPLAIELVARRAHGRTSLAPLWAEWTRIGADLLVQPDFDANRLTSLPYSIELSLRSNRLTPLALRLFRLLGHLPAGIGAEDRDELLGEEGFDAEERLHRIGLSFERDGRIDLLPPIREYALRHYLPEEHDAVTWVNHFLRLTGALGETIGTDTGQGAFPRLLEEFPNIEAAFFAAIGRGRRGEAMIALDGFGRLTTIGPSAPAVFRQLAVACAEDGDMRGKADCIKGLGEVALRRSDHKAAGKALEEARLLYRQVGSVLGEANCIRRLGDLAFERPDPEAARKAYDDARLLYWQIGDVLGEANCISGLADLAVARSDDEAARKAYDEALLLYRQDGHVLGEANCIRSLGDLALARRDHEAAHKAYDEALSLSQQVGDAVGEANCIRGLGDIAFERLDDEAARKAFEEALLLYRQMGSVLGEASCIRRLGDIAFARSDDEAARRAYEEALPLCRRVGSVQGEANCTMGLGHIALARSDHEGARKAFEEALPLLRRVGDRQGEANCIKRLSECE